MRSIIPRILNWATVSMTNRKMDAVQVHDAVVGLQWALSPRLILLGQRLVETAHGARAGGISHQLFRDFPHFVGADPAHKHLGQRFGHLGGVAVVALKHLAMKLPFAISGNMEILNAPGGGHEIASVGPVAVAPAIGRALSP